ncbi:MAG: enoyl-CoA hydratase/isomerase family protein [Mycetocola sp.]
MKDELHVRAHVSGGVGRLTLDRPRALNALDLDMIRELRVALDRWAVDRRVRVVLLDGAGDRGFCAGGDVRALRLFILAGELERVATFFREEYAVNALIGEYPKPVVTLADGVTMGGGIGLAGHAQVRIVTERSILAMPETGIGFTPDVGGSLLLSRAPGRLGEFLALTGKAVNGVDAIFAGLADHLVDSTALGSFVRTLTAGAEIDEALEAAAAPPHPPQGDLEEARAWVDVAFSAGSLPEIITHLRNAPHVEAGQTAELLERLSPTALAVTLESVRRAREIGHLRTVLEQEYRLAMWFASTQEDMPEGIRAVLVDRDRTPHWSPPTLAQLPPQLLSEAFGFVPTTSSTQE